MSTPASSLKVLEYDDEDAFSSAPSHDATNAIPGNVIPCREYTISSEQVTVERKLESHRSTGSSVREKGQYYIVAVPRRVLSDLFLPIGYPNSVGEEYMRYQVCDSLQGLCSYLRGVVSTSAVLTAAGVGDSEATAMSAAMTWAIRDGSGMVGGLLFSYCSSSMFDSHVKEFRLFADVINDVGLTLDMLAPYAGSHNVLYVTSVATVCKVMCGIAAGSTKGSITHHFALRGNMADLNAKESTQETLVSLVGMLLGVVLARYLHRMEQQETETESATAILSWTIFVVLTALHVWVNYIGVKCLHLKTLNRQRATVALAGVIQAMADNCTRNTEGQNGENQDYLASILSSIPEPKEVSESLWASVCNLIFPGSVRLGVRLCDSLMGMTPEDMVFYLQTEFQSERYALCLIGTRTIKVFVTLRVGATDRDELKAFLHAMLIRRCIDQGVLRNATKKVDKGHRNLIAFTHKEMNLLFGQTEQSATKANHSILDRLAIKGWDVQSRLYLGFGRWRIMWRSDKLE